MYDGTPILEVNPLPSGVIFPDATLQPISILQFSLRSLGISMRNITDILIYVHIYKTNRKSTSWIFYVGVFMVTLKQNSNDCGGRWQMCLNQHCVNVSSVSTVETVQDTE